MADIPTKEQVRQNSNVLFDNAPASAVSDRRYEVQVVGKRCVYINNYRVAGGKPYYSENLPNFRLTTTLGDIINAFPEDDIVAALKERRARAEYFKAYHAQTEAA